MRGNIQTNKPVVRKNVCRFSHFRVSKHENLHIKSEKSDDLSAGVFFSEEIIS